MPCIREIGENYRTYYYVKNPRPIRNGGLKKTVFLKGFL